MLPRTLVEVGVILTLLAGAHPPSQQEARTLLATALKAHGGQAVLVKFKAARLKGKGHINLWGESVPATLALTLQGSDRARSEIILQFGAETSRQVIVSNGKRCWVKTDDSPTEESEPDSGGGLSSGFLVGRMLADLKDADIHVLLLPETTIARRPALGLQVTSKKDRRPLKLFFDKQSALLLKSESREKILGREVTQKVFLSGYKEVQGTQQPFHWLSTQDGVRMLEFEFTEIELYEQLDEKCFARP